jgi:hypothetical protein
MSKFSEWLQNRYDRKLEKGLMRLSQKSIKYNPKMVNNVDYINPEREFTLSIAENLVWFIGKPRLLRLFYVTNVDLSLELNYFWRVSPPKYRKVHSGMPANIASKMATILFGNDLNITISNPSLSKEKLDEITLMVQDLIAGTRMMEKFKEGAITESWSGHLFAKWSVDEAISPYPILEIADIRHAELERVRGITTGITFKTDYVSGANRYQLHEQYGKSVDGKATITYTLYELKDQGPVAVSLSRLPETANLEPSVTIDVDGVLAFEKANKLPNNEFLSCPYGASDYSGCASAFDALDEVLSEIYAEMRNNKTIRYVPQSLIEKVMDDDGHIIVSEFDNFVTNVVKVYDDLDQTADNKVTYSEIRDKMESLKEKWKIAITTVCNNAGLSPLALGVTGLESVNAGELSQRERNRVTLETRNIKIASWKPFCEDVIKQGLKVYCLIKQIPYDDVDVSVTFSDYIVESQKDLLTTWGLAKQQRVASTREAIKNCHPEWSDSQIEDELNLIRYEEGVTAETPTNLPSLEDLLEND